MLKKNWTTKLNRMGYVAGLGGSHLTLVYISVSPVINTSFRLFVRMRTLHIGVGFLYLLHHYLLLHKVKK